MHQHTWKMRGQDRRICTGVRCGLMQRQTNGEWEEIRPQVDIVRESMQRRRAVAQAKLTTCQECGKQLKLWMDNVTHQSYKCADGHMIIITVTGRVIREVAFPGDQGKLEGGEK
jgi:hypothetical protein